MGRGFIEFRLPESQRSEFVFRSAFVDYCLEDGISLHIRQQAAWCPHCRRFALAEDISSVEELEEELRRFRFPDSKTLEMWAFVSNGAPISEMIQDLERRIEWRKKRQSPPHCLECGGIGSVPVPGSGEFVHPETGEKVVVGSCGWADDGPWIADFSPEGEILPRNREELDEKWRRQLQRVR